MVPIAMPPSTVDALFPAGAKTSIDALTDITEGTTLPKGPNAPLTGNERSALVWINQTKDLFQAAMDELPALKPFVLRAAEVLSMGLTTVIQSGTGMPMSYPPGASPDQSTPEMPTPGAPDQYQGTPAGASPENMPFPA